MTANELRQLYLQFFADKGHTVIPSASLVPANDPTVLFTTAGMHPLVPYLLGENHPGGGRLVSCQKCIRTGDIEEVGDDVHLTFFEMLGNWSLGDYWKEQAITWSFEFLTKILRLPIEKLAVTCFAGDDDAPRDNESEKLWLSLGVPKERIYFFGKKDNWWGPAGESGPCGPDTEMFYWTGSGEPEPLTTGDNKEKWVEIWNDVFMQYNKTSAGQYEPLKQRNVDTGMGLERTLAVLNGQRSVYDTELFKPLFNVIGLSQEIMTGDEIRKARVVIDHVRAATFMVGDGVEPANKDRGYVLRRLLRRSMVYARLLGLKPHWLKALVGQVMVVYTEQYHELIERSEQIFNIIKNEEEKFVATLERGIKEVKVEVSKSGYVTGSQASVYYQSYGIPFEVTREIVTGMGGQVKDEQDFEKDMAKHQDLSRTASAGTFKGGLADHTEEVVRLHTATHLMNAALRQVLGENVWQKGSNITRERTRFDFTHPQKLTDDEKSKVEELVNQWVAQDYEVKREVMPLAEARGLNAVGVFGEKYSETVSVYSVWDPTTGEVVSREFCGGPHVTHTGALGHFSILKEEAVSAGVRRIKATVS